MAVKTPNSKNEQDEAYSPSQRQVDKKFKNITDDYTSPEEDLQKLENYANGEQPESDKTPKDSRDQAEALEQDAGNDINYTGGNKTIRSKAPIGLREAMRKRGPVAVLIALLFGGFGTLSVFFSAGILPIHLKEVMNEKFNDQLAVMDDQSMHLLKKKFKGQGTLKGCTKISIRCKFNSMSDGQIKRMERRGQIKVHTTGDTTLIRGRNKIDSLEFRGKTITADSLVREASLNKEFRVELRRGYNPKLAGFADSIFNKVSRKAGFTKTKNLNGKTKQEFDQEVRKHTSGKAAAELKGNVTSNEENCEPRSPGCDTNGKKTVYKDENGTTISKDEYDKRLNASDSFKTEIEARKKLSETGSAVTKATLKGALTSTALGLGAVDSACTGYRLIRTIGFAAKYLGMLQLLRYFQIFANTADVDKAGQGTAEANTYIGNILTSPNSQGKAATDSYGYKYAAYGDTDGMPRAENMKGQDDGNGNVKLEDSEKEKTELADEVTKYINGQMITDNLLTDLIKLTGEGTTTKAVDSGCKFIKSGWGQTIVIGTAIVGAVIAFFTGGASLGWGVAIQTAVSVALAIAIAMLTPKLIDMAAGTMINGKENGNQAGNAITSGAGAMNTQTFMARGIPVLQKNDAVAYQEKTEKVLAQYAEEDRIEYSPLDPTHKHTFMGSIVSNILPYATKMSTLTSALPAIVSLSANSIGNLLPKAGAVLSTSEQFNVCEDRDYTEENMAADPFCNLRGGFTDEVMNIDSDAVLDYMIDNNYIEEESGDPKEADNDYAKYLKDCTERTVPLGGETESGDEGTKCVQGRNGADEGKYNMFRKMSVLKSVNEGMDDGEVAKSVAATATETNVVSGDAKQLAQQVADNPNITYVKPATKEQLKVFASGGQVFDGCGKPMTVSKYLLKAMLSNASKYKILVNNIGFKQDRSMCESIPKQHPAGTAVDINNIEIIGGGSTGGSIRLPRGVDIVNKYATDFLAALPLNRGGVGQKDHGVNPTFPPGSVALNGSHLFNDAGNHLHIDARNRENLRDTE